MSYKRILIITKPGSLEGTLIKWLADCWAESGYYVEFISNLNTNKEADIVFLHVDLTHVPLTYFEFSKRYPVVINGNNNSISKELFSNQILEQPFGYKGKVIVKTKENYGGLPELYIGEFSIIERKFINITKNIASSKSFNHRFFKSYIWKKVRVLDPSNYPIFDSIEDVPSGVWKNPRLIVEKFLPEQDADGRYVLRHWYFFGDKEFNRTLFSKNPMPKWSSMNEEERTRSREKWWKIEVLNNAKVPQEVRSVREKLCMDFGRIDWALHNGKPIVFDANKTPSIGVRSLDSDLDLKRHSLICKFSEGIKYFK